MAATLSLDTITSSGSTITVPTGKTMAITDAGNLTIGGVAITTGAQGVISKTGTYTILPGDFTGKSSLIVLVDVSAGTSTETIITLPAEDAFDTCAIHIISTATHGAGNKITIKNDTPTEVYTLYCKNDHCELVSDGTTAFRTGNEYTTIWTHIASSTSYTLAGAAAYYRTYTANVLVQQNYGSAWDAATYEWTAPFTGHILYTEALPTNTSSSAGNPALYKDTGSGFVIVTGTKAGSAGSASTGWYAMTLPINAGNVLRPYLYKNTTSAEGPVGNAAGTAAMWDVRYIRRD
jgi:hypothetical protein